MSHRSALDLWKEKLEDLLADAALAVDGPAKFKLKKDIEEAEAEIAKLSGRAPSLAPRVAPSRLPRTASQLFGREAELAKLEAAWADPKIHVVTLVAWGGVGKTSLVAQWEADLATRDYDGADFFDWSFYSQGTREQGGASSDAFFAEALRFFGDEAMAASAASPWDKGARLAQLVAERRTLLILDGLEPLQYPPGPLAGELKDPAIGALLKGLAAKNSGLCVVTTRESVRDLARYNAGTAPEWELERLATPAGVQLLTALGVHGSKADLEKLVEDVVGHALTLSLLGTYLADAHEGDVRRRDLVDLQEADHAVQGGHAFKAMAAYERWLAEQGEVGARQLAVLRLMGLFDRPADAGCIAALRKAPAIRGLTEPLVGLAKKDWNLACSALRKAHLLAPVPPKSRIGAISDRTVLDAHPLLREHFARRLREAQPEAWRAAHSRLYEHLRDSTERRPDTLEGLQPLYQAVAHGCQAGRYEEARAEVYRDRILRGTEHDGFYSWRRLGAFGADLGAVAAFFEPPWSRVSPAFSGANQAWLLNDAAFHLRALGRLSEALQPMRAGFAGATRIGDWNNAARYAQNLSELELTLGQVSESVRDAEQSVIFADRSGDAFLRVAFRTAQADALHQMGLRAEALKLFREAERMQAKDQPDYPLLYSLQGFQYCDLLLTETERAAWHSGAEDAGVETLARAARDVEERSGKTLQWVVEADLSLLSIVVDHLTLGRARLYRAIVEGVDTSASSDIEQSVAGLRRAGQVQFVPLGLLTRAWLRALQGDPTGAKADLDESQEIAERGPMPLYLADVHLYRARLFRDREALATARVLIEKHGYGRRNQELADAEEAALRW